MEADVEPKKRTHRPDRRHYRRAGRNSAVFSLCTTRGCAGPLRSLCRLDSNRDWCFVWLFPSAINRPGGHDVIANRSQHCTLGGAWQRVFYSYAILLALVSGLFQIAFGLLRMGILLNFLSNPVLMGFINAAAIIIGLSQLPTLLGIPAAQSQHFLLDIMRVVSHIDTAHALSLGFGLSAILMFLSFKKLAPKLLGVLITVASLTWISYTINYANLGGRVVGLVPQGLPTLSLPPLDWHATVALLPASFVIALEREQDL